MNWSKCSRLNGGRVEGQLDFCACISICQHCPPTSPRSTPALCPYIVNREISHGQQVAVWRSHLDFAPDNCGQVAGGSSVSSGGKEFRSQAVEAARTIVPPKPTVRPSGLNPPPPRHDCTERCWRARLPGSRSLGQGHLGPRSN